MALRSWHPKADVSTTVPMVEEPVTFFQASAIVTEQGAAPLFGDSEKEQARALIEQAAHPGSATSWGRRPGTWAWPERRSPSCHPPLDR